MKGDAVTFILSTIGTEYKEKNFMKENNSPDNHDTCLSLLKSRQKKSKTKVLLFSLQQKKLAQGVLSQYLIQFNRGVTQICSQCDRALSRVFNNLRLISNIIKLSGNITGRHTLLLS